MKIKFFLILFICVSTHLYVKAQQTEIDSIKKLIEAGSDDSIKVFHYNWLSKLYRLSKPDSSLWVARKATILAKQIGYLKGEAEGLNGLGNVFLLTGNYPKALEYYLESLKLFEKLENEKGIGVCMSNIALIYIEQGEYRKALEYHLLTHEIFKNNLNETRLINNLLNIGDTYEKLNQLDSALQYTQSGYEMAIRINDKDFIGMALNNLGNIHARLGNDKLAMEYYRLSIPYSLAIDDKYIFGETYLAMAKLFKKTGFVDSSFYYAKKALATGQEISGHKFIKSAAEFLAAGYEEEKSTDSAFRYFKIATVSNDSLFSEEKVRQIQTLKFNEQLRQQELAETRAAEKQQRRNNLQLIGIAVFILTFFLFIIVYSRNKTKSRFVEFMGLLALLLFFEFILLLLHPYIIKWTHHTPVFMLIFQVIIASILAPVHNFLVKWIKRKFSHKIVIANH